MDLEVQVRRIFGGHAGLTIGYTHRTRSWSDQGVRSVFGFLDVVLGAVDGFARNSVQSPFSPFRIGLNF